MDFCREGDPPVCKYIAKPFFVLVLRLLDPILSFYDCLLELASFFRNADPVSN